MDAEQLLDMHRETGLFAHFTPHGILWVLSGLDAAAGHRPGNTAPLGPAREKHPAVVISDDRVCRDPQIHGSTIVVARHRVRLHRRCATRTDAAPPLRPPDASPPSNWLWRRSDRRERRSLRSSQPRRSAVFLVPVA